MSQLESEVGVVLVPLQEEISSQFTDVEELPIDTFVKLPAKLIMELFSLAMMFHLISLRSYDVYNPL